MALDGNHVVEGWYMYEAPVGENTPQKAQVDDVIKRVTLEMEVHSASGRVLPSTPFDRETLFSHMKPT